MDQRRIIALTLAWLSSSCFGDKVLSQGGGGQGEGAGSVVTSTGGVASNGGGGDGASGGEGGLGGVASASGGGGLDAGGGAATTSQGGAGGEGGAGCAVARVFVTSTNYPGDFASGQGDAWAYAQSLCDARALAAGLGSGWQPWLSHGTDDAIDKLTGSGPWRLLDCTTTVASSKADLADTIIDHAIDQDELGGIVSLNAEVWTGTNPDGTSFGNDCQGWTTTFSFNVGRSGRATDFNSKWTSNTNGACSGMKRLYCFEP